MAIVAGILFVLNMVLTVLISKKASSASELLEGLVSPIEIKDEKAVRKTGSLVIVIILLVFILLAVYFASFIRLEGLPKIW